MLCKIAVMINFIHKTRCNADLIAVGAVALRRRCSKFSLGKMVLSIGASGFAPPVTRIA